MALPQKAYRKDIIVRVEFDPATSPDVFTNWCGATAIGFSLNNEIISEKSADCTDWSAPIKTLKSYGAQNATINVDATWARSMYTKTFKWAHEQKTLNFEIEVMEAATGEIELITGAAMLGQLDWGQIGNTEGNSITETVALEVTGDFTAIEAV